MFLFSCSSFINNKSHSSYVLALVVISFTSPTRILVWRHSSSSCSAAVCRRARSRRPSRQPHHAALEEARQRSGWSVIISANRQPAGAVEAVGAPRRPAATRLPECGWATPGTTVGLPSSSLDGDSSGQNPLWHSLGARHWRPLYADTSGLVSCVRHRRSRHSFSPSGGLLWPRRYRVELVQVISQRS